MKNIFIGLICLSIGVVIFGLGTKLYKKAKASETWPTVVGEVFSSDVSSYTDSKKKTMYRANINYSFVVNGKEYTSDDISMSESSSSNPGYAKKVCYQYPVGKKVKVFYDPKTPSSSLLEPGISFVLYLPMIGGAVFFLIGVGIFLKPILKLIFVFFASR